MPPCPKCLNYAFENPLEAWDQDPDGFCLLHSEVKDKDKNGAFTMLIEEKKKREDFNFAGVFFPGEVCFQNFTFPREVDFAEATFAGNAVFREAMFSGNAAFPWATFSENADFFGVTFSEKADFLWARLEDKAKMIMTYMNKLQGDFRSLAMEPGAKLLVQDCNLSQASFTESDLTRIEFDRVTWAKQRGRTAVYDELVWREKKEDSPESVERLYRQLKSNYEEKKDYKRVGDFHYGEMEMHRLGSFWRRHFPLSWYNLYWALNGYGERPLRAFIWFGVFLVAFTGTISWLGVNITSSGNPASWSETFRFVIDKATLQRPDWARPVTEWGHWLAATTVFIIPGQLALFFLALRNRLGRRR